MHWHVNATGVIVLRLLLAAVLGGLVGLERGVHRKPAGLRTSMFICLGSALFTVLSGEIARQLGDTSSTRIVSNLIPGIGFLGAGAIIRDRGSVVGLTTAATIFVMAGVGLAVGGGFYMVAIFTVLLILLALTALGWLEDRFGLKTRLVIFRLTTSNLEDAVNRTHIVLGEMKVPMQHFQVFRVGTDMVMEFDADVSYTQQQRVFEQLSRFGSRCEVVPSEGQRE